MVDPTRQLKKCPGSIRCPHAAGRTRVDQKIDTSRDRSNLGWCARSRKPSQASLSAPRFPPSYTTLRNTAKSAKHQPTHVQYQAHTCVIFLPEDVGLADHHHSRQHRPPLRIKAIVLSSFLALTLGWSSPFSTPRVFLAPSSVGGPASPGPFRVSVRCRVAAATGFTSGRRRGGGAEHAGSVQAIQGVVPGLAAAKGESGRVRCELQKGAFSARVSERARVRVRG